MQAPPPTDPPARSPLVRYAPFIAVVVIIAIVGGDRRAAATTTTKTKVKHREHAGRTRTRADHLQRGEGRGHARQVHVAGRTATPRPASSRSRSSTPRRASRSSPATTAARRAPGVTGDTIRIGYYMAKPDPQFDITRQGGRRVRPARADHARRQGLRRRSSRSLYETLRPQDRARSSIGHAELVRRDRGPRRRRQGRRGDDVFAVIGGPTQTQGFADELTSRGVMCVGTLPRRAAAGVLRREHPVPVRRRARCPSSRRR